MIPKSFRAASCGLYYEFSENEFTRAARKSMLKERRDLRSHFKRQIAIFVLLPFRRIKYGQHKTDKR